MVTHFQPLHETNTEKFSFSEQPFTGVADFRFLYLSKEQANLLKEVNELAVDRRGLIVVKGDNGLGKTSIALRHSFQLGLLANHHPLLFRMNQKCELVDFWKFIANQCYLPLYERVRHNQRKIKQLLNDTYGEVYIDLIIDNAEEMNSELADAINELDAWMHMGERLVQVILFGTPDIAKFAFSPTLEKSMKPMSYQDVRSMIEYRLFVSGSPQLFSNEANQKIYKLTEGNPRRVVNLCRTCLEVIVERGKQFVDGNDIDEIAQIAGFASPNVSRNQGRIGGRPNSGTPRPEGS